MFGEIFKGIAQRVRLENSLQLQRAKLIRPKQIKLEVAKFYKEVSDELADPVIAKHYNEIVIHVPDEEVPQPAVREVRAA